MFGWARISVVFLLIILLLAGCGFFSGSKTGIEPTETRDLDGDFEFSQSLKKGDLLALDVRIPVKSGYVIVGASFDPAVLTLEHFLEYADDGEPRAQYVFKAVEDGLSDVVIKMQSQKGGNIEIYKRVTVNVGASKTLF